MKIGIWNERRREECSDKSYEYWHALAWTGITEVIKDSDEEDAIEAYQRFIREMRER